MSNPVASHRIRLKIDLRRDSVTLDNWTNRTPRISRGFDTQIECGIYFGDDLADISALSTATLKIKPVSKRTANAFVEVSISPVLSADYGVINSTCTSTQWEDESDQHLLFKLSSTATNFAIPTGTNVESYYCLIYGTDTNGKLIDLTSFTIELEERGQGGTAAPTPAPPDTYYKAEIDALMAGTLRASNPAGTSLLIDKVILRDTVTGGLVEVSIDNGTIVATPIA